MLDPNRPPPPTRDTAARLMLQEVGSPGHARIMEYHDNAFGRETGDKELEWCGLLCLAMLHDAGIALSVFWRQGGGFCEEQRLDKFGPKVPWAKTRVPEVGDIVYYDAPYRHHAMVIAVDAERRTYDTVDGNQLNDTVVIKRGLSFDKPTCFYSIRKLLPSGES